MYITRRLQVRAIALSDSELGKPGMQTIRKDD
jgi:hypothetical protein